MRKYVAMIAAAIAGIAWGDNYVTEYNATYSYVGSFLYSTNRTTAKIICGPTTLSARGAVWMMATEFKNLPIVEIGNSAFASSTIDASGVVIPVDVVEIGDCAFQKVSTIPRFYLPDGLLKIGNEAFALCTTLVGIEIPASVSSIGKRPFYSCSALASISVDEQNPNYKSVDGALYDKSASVLIAAPLARASVSLPTTLKEVSEYGFYGSKLEMCAIPCGVSTIGQMAFAYSKELRCVSIPDSVIEIGDGAFIGCGSLSSVVIPAGVKRMGAACLSGCSMLKQVVFKGEPPSGVESAGIPEDAKIIYPESKESFWKSVVGVKVSYNDFPSEPIQTGVSTNLLMTTNVVVHYVLNSIKPEFALPPSHETGFVNIIAEVKGGFVSIPESWSDNYASFKTVFGSDFTRALSMPSGKKDGAGNDMFVWQDYVAGTDPTNPDDKFTASISVVEGKIVISYEPELDDARKNMRKYTVWGKKGLTDDNWVVVPDGKELDYNFFKVTVEMK